MAKVVEVLPAGEYTIARMDACGVEAWTAGPPTELTVGQTVEMPTGTVPTSQWNVPAVTAQVPCVAV